MRGSGNLIWVIDSVHLATFSGVGPLLIAPLEPWSSFSAVAVSNWAVECVWGGSSTVSGQFQGGFRAVPLPN